MSVFRNPLSGGKFEKTVCEIKIQFAERNSYFVFLCKSVLCNYIIILLQCISFAPGRLMDSLFT